MIGLQKGLQAGADVLLSQEKILIKRSESFGKGFLYAHGTTLREIGAQSLCLAHSSVQQSGSRF